MPKHLVNLVNWSAEDVESVLTFAEEVKDFPDRYRGALSGKTLAMIFEKPSTRTRISFSQAMVETGGFPLYLSSNDLQIGRGETIEDTAKVLSRYVHGIMIRTFGQDLVEELARHASIPVINGLTDAYHPCQALADAQTIKENFGCLKGLTLSYVGDGNNVAHSLMLIGAKTGMNVRVITPEGYEPDDEIVKIAGEAGRATAATIETSHNVEDVKGSQVIYTDTWVSMGQDSEREEKLKKFKPYQVNDDIMKMADGDAIFMHCLPCHREEEVTASVIDGPQSVVFDEAENRLHAQKALLISLMT